MRGAAVSGSGVAQAAISQAGAQPAPPGRVYEPAAKPVGVHLRVDHGVPVPRSEDRGLALPVRREPEVQRVRLPRLHRPSRRGRTAAGARVEAPKHLQRVPSRRTVGASRSRAAKNLRLTRFPASVPFDGQGLRENPSLSDDVEVSADGTSSRNPFPRRPPVGSFRGRSPRCGRHPPAPSESLAPDARDSGAPDPVARDRRLPCGRRAAFP